MKALTIEASLTTPMIDFSSYTGIMKIAGCGIPSDSELFWKPIKTWFSTYASSPTPITHIKIDLDYFNMPFSKELLSLLYALREIANRNYQVQVTWNYKLHDDEMYEVGQDFAFMSKVPFEFIVHNETELIAN